MNERIHTEKAAVDGEERIMVHIKPASERRIETMNEITLTQIALLSQVLLSSLFNSVSRMREDNLLQKSQQKVTRFQKRVVSSFFTSCKE